MRFIKTLAAVVILAAVLTAAFAGGITYERTHPYRVEVPSAPEQSALGAQVENVRNILDRQALKPSSEASMTRGAIEGMLGSLEDSYAVYFDAKHFKYFNEQTQGKFYGIGINLSVKDGQPIVVSPIKGTPAYRAGLKANDKIVSIDGITKKKWDLDGVVNMVRGREGTKVKLGISRKGESKTLYYTIERAKIDVPNTEKQLLAGGVGYIRMYGFNEESGQQIADAVNALKKKGAKGYILDLRDNPGGLLSSAVDVTSLFVSDGVVVRVDERDKPETVYRVSGDTISKAPLVLLVDDNSASASEIVAGALQDHGRAKLVGVKTFGKGSVQTIEQLPNGAAMKFTIAHYLTPNRRSIDHKGLIPDVVVPMDYKLQADKAKDTQLQRAIQVLRAEF